MTNRICLSYSIR